MFKRNKSSDPQKAVIYGGGPEAALAGQAFANSAQMPFRLVGFIDAARAKLHIADLPVAAPDEHSLRALAAQGVECILVPADAPAGKVLGDFLDLAFRCGIRQARRLPPAKQWANDSLSAHQLQEISIEEIWEPAPLRFENEQQVLESIRGKRVLISGAAGAIGSELARQLIRLQPSALLLIDVAEAPLHQLLMELRQAHLPDCNIYPMLGDVSDRSRMEYAFDIYHPDLVFHAAAYKQVQLLEDNPSIAVLNNVVGTRNLAELAVGTGVEAFVLISTDQAENPVSVMGASKRIAEIYIQSLAQALPDRRANFPHTKLIITRFADALGSFQPIASRIQRQIDAGGPVTIPRHARSFLDATVAEACQLVIEASAMSEGGELFVFDMGAPVRIAALAEKMIRLAGKEPGQDIEISLAGSRAGEKHLAEMQTDAEESTPTQHKKIRVAKARNYNIHTVAAQLDALTASARMHYILETVQRMKEMAPEFGSHHPTHERLDTTGIKKQSAESLTSSPSKPAADATVAQNAPSVPAAQLEAAAPPADLTLHTTTSFPVVPTAVAPSTDSLLPGPLNSFSGAMIDGSVADSHAVPHAPSPSIEPVEAETAFADSALPEGSPVEAPEQVADTNPTAVVSHPEPTSFGVEEQPVIFLLDLAPEPFVKEEREQAATPSLPLEVEPFAEEEQAAIPSLDLEPEPFVEEEEQAAVPSLDLEPEPFAEEEEQQMAASFLDLEPEPFVEEEEEQDFDASLLSREKVDLGVERIAENELEIHSEPALSSIDARTASPYKDSASADDLPPESSILKTAAFLDLEPTPFDAFDTISKKTADSQDLHVPEYGTASISQPFEVVLEPEDPVLAEAAPSMELEQEIFDESLSTPERPTGLFDAEKPDSTAAEEGGAPPVVEQPATPPPANMRLSTRVLAGFEPRPKPAAPAAAAPAIREKRSRGWGSAR